MSKPRIVVTCPNTGVVVVTTIAYAEMTKPRKTPMLFKCPCGETHKLAFAGRHGAPREPQRMQADSPRAS